VRKSFKPIAGLAAIAGVLVFIYPWMSRSADSSGTTSAAHPTGKVRVVRPVAGRLSRVCLQPATFQSWDIVDLDSQVSGILTGQTVDINSEVKKDQVLAVIEAPDVRKERDLEAAMLVRAKAQVVLAQKELDAARANRVATQKLVLKLQAQAAAAEASFRYHANKMRRFRKMAEANAIEFEALDHEEDEYQDGFSRKEDFKAGLIRAREDEKTWKARVDEAQASVRVAERSVGVARAALEKAQIFVDFTKIKAPFDGVITQRSYNNGAYIRAKGQGGQVPLLTVRRTDKFRVLVDIPDVDVPFVQVGDPVYLKVFSLGLGFPGKVDRLALSESPAHRMMRAEVDMDNGPKGVGKGLLQDGMYGEMAIRVNAAMPVDAATLTIPSICLHDGENGCKKVLVVRSGPDNTFRIDEPTVHVGYNDGEHAEVFSGLTADDRVVVESQGMVCKDAIVDVVND
jgi:HlyD family secretion protein